MVSVLSLAFNAQHLKSCAEDKETVSGSIKNIYMYIILRLLGTGIFANVWLISF